MRKKLPHHINVADLIDLGITTLRLEEPKNNSNDLNIPPGYILISGSYKENHDNDLLCKMLGSYISKLNVGVVSGAGKSGFMVSQSLYHRLIAENRYDPDRIIFYFRRKEREPKRLVDDIGTIKFYGNDPFELRQRMISEVRAVIIIGGKGGTKEEEQLASMNNIPVIPIATSGGAALEIWETYKRNSDIQSIGVQQFEAAVFEELNSINIYFAIDAAIALLKSSLNLT